MNNKKTRPTYDRTLIDEQIILVENQLANCMRQLSDLRKSFYSNKPSTVIQSLKRRGMRMSFIPRAASYHSQRYKKREMKQ